MTSALTLNSTLTLNVTLTWLWKQIRTCNCRDRYLGCWMDFDFNSDFDFEFDFNFEFRPMQQPR